MEPFFILLNCVALDANVVGSNDVVSSLGVEITLNNIYY